MELTEEQKVFIQERFVNVHKWDFNSMVMSFKEIQGSRDKPLRIEVCLRPSNEHGIVVHSYYFKELLWFNAYADAVYVTFVRR